MHGGVQNWLWPVGPTNPLNLHLILARTDATNDLFQVFASKAWRWRVEWRVLFSKTWAIWPDAGYIQIWRNRAQIRGDPASSQPYLVRFSQIQPFPADFSYFEKRFGDFDADLVSFYIFWGWFCRFWRIFFFLQMSVTFKAPLTTWNQSTNPISTQAQTRSIDAGGQFRVTLLSTQRLAGRVRAGLKTDPAQPADSPRCAYALT